MKKLSALLISVLLLFSFSSCATANMEGHAKKEAPKKAILLVTFGTSVPKAEASFKNIERLAKKRYPDTEIRWAYTAKIIRHKIAKEGKMVDSTAVALAKLADEGYNNVVVQSLHVIPGAEYDDMKDTVSKFRYGVVKIDRLVIGKPLLYHQEDVNKVAKIMMTKVPATRKADEAVLLMGHGTHHAANLIYGNANAVFGKLDKNAFLGTVEGNPSFEDVLAACKANNIKKAYLLPFMSVAGDHAMNDMAGDEADSWKMMLKKEGIEAIPVVKGMGEYDEIVNIWLDHLDVAYKHLD